MKRLELAKKIASEIITKIQSRGYRVELIGSVARGSANPKDVDIRVYVRGKAGKKSFSAFVISTFPVVRQSQDAFWSGEEEPIWFPVADCIEGQINTDIFYKVL